MSAKDTLIEELRRHALIIGEVTLTSGATAQYYVDAKRAILRPAGFAALAELVAGFARQWEATAVGGLTMGADAPACAALAGGADVKAFFVRKETKAHGLQRKVEGPPLEPGERCLIVEDVVTTGGSTVQAIEAVRAEGYDVVGVVTVLDRLAGGAANDRARLRRRAVRGAGDDRRRLPGPPRPVATSPGEHAAQGTPSGAQCPRQESNLHPALRRRVLYPLSYEGRGEGYGAPNGHAGAQGVGCCPVRGTRGANPPSRGLLNLSTGTGASDLLHAEDSGVDEIVAGKSPVAARSPLQLFWRRFRKDKVALAALTFIVLLILVGDLRRRRSASILGAPPPNVGDDRRARRLRPARPGPSSEHLLRRRRARPRHLLARPRRRPGLAAGGVRRHRPVGDDRRDDGHDRRLLPRLGGHA